MYSNSNSNNGANTEEFDHVQRQINEKTNESLESTRRMLGLVVESQEVGTNTMIMLDEQGEQLNRIETGLDNIHVGMNQAEKNLDQLQKCCGLCVLPWNRRRLHMQFNNSSTATSSEKSSPTIAEPKLRMAGEEGIPTSGYITRITNDDRENEMDGNLQLVASHLGNLKNMALDMGDTINQHNKVLDRLAEETDSGVIRLGDANKQAKEILGQPA